MAIKDIPPPLKTEEPDSGTWSQLQDWLKAVYTFVRTPALVASGGNVPTAPTGTPGDTSTQIATDAFVANAITTAIAGVTPSLRMLAPTFPNSGALVAQRATAGTLSTTRVIGQCDNIGVWASGGAVSAGTISQITTAISGATGYSCRAAGVTLTGSGQISHSIRMEAKDAIKCKNKTVSFSVQVDHDVGSTINYKLVVKKPTAADNFASTTTIATSANIAVVTATSSLLVFNAVALGDVSFGLELEVQAVCGAVTTKNFNVTEFYLNIEAVAGPYYATSYEQELDRCLRYLPSLISVTSSEDMALGFVFATTGAVVIIPFQVQARVAPTGILASPPGNFNLNIVGGMAAVTALAITTAGRNQGALLVSVASGLSPGNCTKFIAVTNPSQILFTGCEL